MRIGCAHRRLLDRFQVALLKVRNTGNRQVKLVRSLPLKTPRAMGWGQRRIQRGHHGVRRRSRATVVLRSRMTHVARSGMPAHVARIHQHLVMVRRGVVRRHAMVRGLLVMVLRLVVEPSRAAMAKSGSVVMGLVGVRVMVMLALLDRMRVLWRVIDIVVRSYSVVARQRVSDAWGPPERTALAGRRVLYGKNLLDGGPAGLRRKEWAVFCKGVQRLGFGFPQCRRVRVFGMLGRCDVDGRDEEHAPWAR